MNDWGKSVLEQYPFEVKSTVRGRGCLLCETSAGYKQLAECTWGVSHLEQEASILRFLKEQGQQPVDAYVPTKNGALYAENTQQVRYVVKDWFHANECNVNSSIDLGLAVRTLAKTHALLRQFPAHEETIGQWNPILWNGVYLPDEFQRRNNELRRVRTYIRNKKKKTDFERNIFAHISDIVEQGEEAKRQLEAAGYEELYREAIEKKQLCHGSCSQHSVLIRDGNVALVQFQKVMFAPQITDLYFFMRKVLEKNHYSVRIGTTMMEDYSRILPITKTQRAVLRAMFLFPEKYWKQMNYYLNNSKHWISPRSVEKLEQATRQLSARMEFVRKIS